LARADEEFARNQAAAARAEATAACAQRDLARTAARRAAAGAASAATAAAGYWRGKLEQPAARWNLFMGLLGRLGVLRLIGIIPPRGRQFMKEHLMRWASR